MLKKSLAFGGMLGLIILLDPTPTPAQPGGKRDRGSDGSGGKTPGGFGQPPGGGFGQPPGGGFGQPPGGGGFGKRDGGGFGQPPGGGGFGKRDGGGFGQPPGGGYNPGGGFGQPGGGFGQPGGGGGMGGGRTIDPEMAWAMLQRLTGSQGDSVDLGAIPPETAAMMKSMTERRGGIPLPPSGIMTKQDFLAHFAKSEAARANYSGGGAAPVTISMGPDGRFSMGGPGGYGPGGFGPGGYGPGGFGPGGQQPQPKEVEEPRPVAMRYGTLPYDKLPDWFKTLDLDKDGQISLYEWRKANDMKEFMEMDLNGDGLVTADEYLRFARQKNLDTKVTAYENGDIDRSGLQLGTPLDGKGEAKGGERTKGGPPWGNKGGDSSKTDGGGDKSKSWGTPPAWGDKSGKSGNNPWNGGKKGN